MAWRNDREALNKLKEMECFLIGIDGTVCLGEHLIDGSIEFIEMLTQAGKKVVFITNNSSHDARFHKKVLKENGCAIDRGQIITSGKAAAEMLNEQHPGERVYVLGNEYLKDELNEAGVKVVNSNFSVMLAGFDTTLTYEKLAIFSAGVHAGKPYYSTHQELFCPTRDGNIPSIGAILAFIEASTGRRPDFDAGKPGKAIIDAAIKAGGAQPNKTAIIGDSLDTEITAGKRAGLLSILVLTGLSSLKDAEQAKPRPDLVYTSIADIMLDI